jgi:hypothetical protein
MQEVLVDHERIFRDLERVIKGLRDIREVWTERKLGDHMGQVHLVMIHMHVTIIAMTEHRNM